MKRDPFWTPERASDKQREDLWRKLGKAARGSIVLIGIKY